MWSGCVRGLDAHPYHIIDLAMLRIVTGVLHATCMLEPCDTGEKEGQTLLMG